jgi:hypothetical protein
MTSGLQRTFAWSGIAFVLLLFAALIVTGLLPPMSPMRSAGDVAEFWSAKPDVKRFGLVLMLAAAGLQAPVGVLIAMRIKQMEGRLSAWAYVELIGCALSVLAIILPTFAFAAASYRPERNPEITQALNDLGWLQLIMNWPAGTMQCLALAFAIFGAARPVFPRWFGYWNLWCAFIFAAGALAVLFKDGVFAWNGLLAFWLAATFFGVWYLIMTWQLLATIGTVREAGDESASLTRTTS